jgi:uncharacterized protein
MSLRELEPLKTSRYVSVLQMANGDAVVFSGMSGAALKVTLDKRPEYDSLCSNRRISDSPLVNLAYDRVRRKFVTAMILVPHELDEIAYLENQFHGTLYVDTTLHMTLVPTLNCNLACPYCYNASRHGTMDERRRSASRWHGWAESRSYATTSWADWPAASVPSPPRAAVPWKARS